MQITITPPAGQPFILADNDSASVVGADFSLGAKGICREGFVNKQRRQVQRQALFRAAYTFMGARFNWENRITFTVQRGFETVEDCITFIATHPDTVPASGEVEITNTSSTGTVEQFLPVGYVESVECVKHMGKYCEFQYSIVGNQPWQPTP